MKKNLPRKWLGKIKSPEQLARAIARKRRVNHFVFTNGCFDILHAGHVTYLEQARAQGSQLIVALNDDQSVSRLKGPTRPINPLQDRLKVIAALESVDYVTWFTADTPLSIILKLKPDILVKGGDWSVNEIVGAREVLGWGGKVKSLKFLKGRSTTLVLERAKGQS